MMRTHSLRLFLLPLLAVTIPSLLFGNGSSRADDRHDNDRGENQAAVRLLKIIPVPVGVGNTTGGLFSFDISWVDQATQTYYLADRSNRAVDIVDAEHPGNVFQLTATPPFAGMTTGSAGMTTGGIVTVDRRTCFASGPN
jgi:hypothetical protein